MADQRLSDAERRRRARLRRKREELRRRKRRKAYILRGVLAAAGILLIILAVRGIAGALGSGKEAAAPEEQVSEELSLEQQAEILAAQYDYDGAAELLNSIDGAGRNSEIQDRIQEYDARKAELTEIPASEIRHFSFPILLVNAGMAAEGTAPLTVEQFNQILQQLYENGYVLVDIYDLAETVTESDGSVSYQMGSVYLPEGKKPFVLSQRDVSYPFDKAGQGYASRLVLDEEGSPVSEYLRPDGTLITGDYDVVPCLEAFLEEHPDFCYRGARGTLGLTGYNGILGYRTSAALASEEDNPYAEANGVFDTDAEAEACRPVLEALKEKGWNFACNGNGTVSYGSEFSLVQEDAEQWQDDVASLAGASDILLLPMEADIGSRSGYTEENEKYVFLREQGFRFFCAEAGNSAAWIQIRPEYVRQGVHEINTYEDFQGVMALDGA